MNAALLLAVLVSAAPFSAKFIGENRGSNPDSESNNAFEQAAGGVTGPAETHSKPAPEPEAARPPKTERSKPVAAKAPAPARAKAERAPAEVRAAAASAPAEEAKAPQSSMSIAPAASAPQPPASAADAGAAAVESAAAGEQRRYDGGAERAPLQSAPEAPIGPAAPPPTPDSFTGDPVPIGGSRAAGPEGEVFVAIDLENRPDRDAVADLGRTVGFRPDARFAPMTRGGGAWVWGWMKPSKVAEAFRVEGVNRLQVDHPARRAAVSETTTRMALQIRLDSADAQTAAASVESDLKDVGVKFLALGEPSEGTVTVEAEAPVRSLGRLLGHPRILSLGERPAAPAPAVVEASAGPSADFMDYAARKAPWLLLITLLLLLPPVARGLSRFFEVFVPYRR